MRKHLSILFLLVPLLIIAQKRPLPLNQIVDGSLQPKALEQLQWQASLPAYTYVDAAQLIQEGIDSSKNVLLSTTQLNRKLETFGKSVGDFPAISWLNDSTFYFWVDRELFTFELAEHLLTRRATLEAGAEHIDVGPGLGVAYTIGNNLWVNYQGNNLPVSLDGNRRLVYGKATHRFEFGISKGTFWSPKGSKLAFYRTDHSLVSDYPLADYAQTPAAYRPLKYPMAGQASHTASVGVYDMVTTRTVYLQTGKPADQYLTNICWHPDGNRIYVAVVNRAQSKMMLNEYDASSGAFLQTLFEEENEKYVEPEHPMYFLPGKGNQFIWMSERDGYNHLYLYKANGHLVRQLTKGPWVVSRFLGFNNQGTQAFFEGTGENNPLERHLYSVNLLLPFGKPKQLSQQNGVHSGMPSADGKWILDSYSNRIVPLRTQLLSASGGKAVKRIWEAPNPLASFKIGTIDFFHLRAGDGSKLYCRMIKPADFDSTRKYPVIVYVYGGPHIQLIDESWLGDSRDLLFLHYLANKGFIIFTLDNRGSANRGLEFEQAIFRRMGTVEVWDQMKGINYLKQLPYIDARRIGVYGGSYGGFMSMSLMLKEPEVFRVGVARGPVTDWKYYEVMYTERYMDTPAENPGGYQEASLLNHAGKLKGNLLIIHGLQDSTVLPQHSFAFLQACIEQGVAVDFFVYPRHAHSVRGKDRIDFYRRIAAYFEEHL